MSTDVNNMSEEEAMSDLEYIKDPREASDIIDEMNETLNGLFNSFRKKANEQLRLTLEKYGKRLDGTELEIKKLKSENDALHTGLVKLEKKIEELEVNLTTKTDENEQYGRRNALRFSGILVKDIPTVSSYPGGVRMIMDTDTFIRVFCQEKFHVRISSEGLRMACVQS
jgi:hypothetical protein